ncbi:hypothetical protein, partial [Brytella acorum]
INSLKLQHPGQFPAQKHQQLKRRQHIPSILTDSIVKDLKNPSIPSENPRTKHSNRVGERPSKRHNTSRQ